MEKNETYDVEILDNGMSLEGIAKVNQQIVFVPGAIQGESVRIKIIKNNKKYAIGKIENFLVKSANRIEPFCEVYRFCGGCQAQHISYTMQLKLKKELVKNVVRKQKLEDIIIDNTIGMGMPYYYRNKVQYPVGKNKAGETVMGFFSKRTHDIVPNICCYIQNNVIDILAKNILDELIAENLEGYAEETKTGDIRHILIRRGYHTKEILVTIVVSRKELLNDRRFLRIATRLMDLNENIKSFYLNLNDTDTNEILGDTLKLIRGTDCITDFIGKNRFFISPKSFFQVNTIQAELLYATLKEELHLQGHEIVFDLYSGVGSIGIFLSGDVGQVYGIEIEKEAVEMANRNIQENNISNAEYIAGSVEDKIVEFEQRKIKPDVIVVDPPRKGLDEKSIEYLLKFKPKKIGYVSCNPATLARDLKCLEEAYHIQKITPVDMFPYTSHVECVAVLQLKA